MKLFLNIAQFVLCHYLSQEVKLVLMKCLSPILVTVIVIYTNAKYLLNKLKKVLKPALDLHSIYPFTVKLLFYFITNNVI